MGGLTPAQQTKTLRLMRGQECTCGCGMKIAECRIKDPTCAYSKGLSAVIVGAIKKGKTEAGAIAEAKASKYGQVPDVKLLEDAVNIPTANSPWEGPANAPITLVEFSDFECPSCRVARDVLEQVNAAYPGKVRWVFRQFPLELHEHAQAAAEASLCAEEQGKFWAYHDALFQKPGRLERDDLRESAGAVGLDLRKFSQCLESRKTQAQVREDVAAGQAAGVSAPPALFINGVMMSGARPLEDLKKVIDEQLGAN